MVLPNLCRYTICFPTFPDTPCIIILFFTCAINGLLLLVKTATKIGVISFLHPTRPTSLTIAGAARTPTRLTRPTITRTAHTPTILTALSALPEKINTFY